MNDLLECECACSLVLLGFPFPTCPQRSDMCLGVPYFSAISLPQASLDACLGLQFLLSSLDPFQLGFQSADSGSQAFHVLRSQAVLEKVLD